MKKVSKDPSYKDFEYALKTGDINALKYINESLLRRTTASRKFKEYNDPTPLEALYLFQTIVSSIISDLENFHFSK